MRKYAVSLFVCIVIVVLFCGCEQKTEAEPEMKTVPAGPLALRVSFETTTTNGRYSPRNAHVVWVETADGRFVKTLDLWARRYASHLKQWAAAVGDLQAEIQARTGASEKAYGTYTSRWDMKDAAGSEVPDGEYVIRFELTSDNAPRNNYHRASIVFTKNDMAMTTEPVNQGGYQNIVLAYQPAGDVD